MPAFETGQRVTVHPNTVLAASGQISHEIPGGEGFFYVTSHLWGGVYHESQIATR